jgi:large subunit ribosomal protein L25
MSNTDLAAQPRIILGKKVKKLRRQGIVPANIYGRHVEPVALQASAVELKRVVRAAGHTGLVRIALDGESAPRTALVRAIQREATTGNLVHVEFQQVSMTEKMTVRVPIVLIGHAPVSALGGMVVQALDGLDLVTLPGDIPAHIEVDVSGMTALDTQIHVSDISLPPNVEVTADPTILVASVSRESSEAQEAEATGTEAAPAVQE